MPKIGEVTLENIQDIQYFTNKYIRRGMVTHIEIRDFNERYGTEPCNKLLEELENHDVRLIDDKEIPYSPQTNVLMNDLRLVELVFLALQMPVAPKIRRKLYFNILKRRNFELDLKRLDYLDIDDEWYYCSPSFNQLQHALKQLFDSGEIPFSKEWKNEMRLENHKYLNSLITHPLFINRIVPQIRVKYIGLKEVKLLVSWIKATGKDMPTMVDIVQTGLRLDGPDLVRGVLFSNQASTAISALKNRSDVCFSCPSEKRCLPINDAEDLYGILTEYRKSDIFTLLAKRYPDQDWFECLGKDWMIAKFFLPYSIVVSAKRWMQLLSIIDQTVCVHDKSHGLYCPKNDIWRLSAQT